ncbi:MAG: class I SAM-dependent rRNA methyltransferase [Flavobacteriales bacterium]|jgi:23S rRNA (cytosine1962-C5)-methyltransferase|nr:class I SAM-dependent rRNA methyltransferase [Flavobacteriales bacterium]MBT3963315.1 class I SAM-dependent rRNA methyltransferase [Flavobacteriales bacterium]MBT4705512.1 class I SAM-dependent rRNA methyltransferase [Flavobacteriales bacterium]MBT4930828.1 class I SAM-dependent rRNA methyltransferase [Flavobacteriales bacterium]MBT5132161.1 class I SAM-dependent rRNA methyltransferase [Flavobacteriales bacterium]
MTVAHVRLKKGRERSILRRHPWIFSGAVQSISEEINEGDLVDIIDHNGGFLARGHFSSGSLCIKILSFENDVIDAEWFLNRLKKAKVLREELNLPSSQTNCFRLVHGEGDGLAGLIIDIYDEIAVIQTHSAGMKRSLESIKSALLELGYQRIVLKPVGKEKSTVLSGTIEEREKVLELGLTYHIDILHGQKTGFFIDQRNSRDLVKSYSKGRKMLNVFSYTGGFSIASLAGGGTEAVSLDASAKALELAEENAALNGFSERHQAIKADAVPFLESNSLDEYDLIVLDPPAFAKHKSARHNAIQAYRRINEAAIKGIASGGILFTFSCSQVIDRQMFYDTIISAAIQARREVKVLYHLRQPEDHPVNIFHPEGEYLKGLVLKIF